MKSAFISGLINEEKESLSLQLSLWHHLTLRNILQRKFTGWIMEREDLSIFLEKQSETAAKNDTIKLMAWKLNEIMKFLKIPIPKQLDTYSLNAIGIEIEVQSTALLRKMDKNFNGSSPDEMVRYLLIKIINHFSDNFKTKDNQSQEEIIKKIIDILESMPKDQQIILKDILSAEEFSPDMIRKAIFDHTLSTALASFMMMVRYTIYYEISKIVIVLSGALSLYIARPYVKSIIPVVLFFFSPIAMASIGIGLTWWTDVYTNKQIQSFLLPIMVMTSILNSPSINLTSSENNLTSSENNLTSSENNLTSSENNLTSYQQKLTHFIEFYNKQY